MGNTTLGVKVATEIGSPRTEESSMPKPLATGTLNGLLPTGETVKSTEPERKPRGQSWTQQQAREILAQTILECQRSGLSISVLYAEKRNSIVVELKGHKIVNGSIVESD